MTLKKKILWGYGFAFVLMALLLAWAVTNLVSLGEASDAILRENYRSILAAENMIDALERQDSGVLLVMLGERSHGTRQYQDGAALFLQWLARAKDNITIAGEAELIRSIEDGYRTYRDVLSGLTGPSKAESSISTVDVALYMTSIYPAFEEIRHG